MSNFVLELQGCLYVDSDRIVVNEIEAYDKNNQKLSIDKDYIYGYDTIQDGEPMHWNSIASGRKSFLVDGNTTYFNSTVFLAAATGTNKTNLGLSDIARINFSTDNICSSVKVYEGFYRYGKDIPQVISLYKLKKEYRDNTFDYNLVISDFDNYKNYYELIRTVDMTTLSEQIATGKPFSIDFSFTPDFYSEKIYSLVVDKILNHELISNIIRSDINA